MAEFVVDTSILVAMINREAGAERFSEILQSAQWAIGWPTVFEARIWCTRNNAVGEDDPLPTIINDPQVTKIEFGEELEALAAQAYRTFGKGQHPAKLNFGDCMAYAAAKHLDLPLLFKGGDFAQTDLMAHEASVGGASE